jgi:Ca-activated chloride channel family protein
MTNQIPATLSLNLGLDRHLAWAEGGSVRYLVAEIGAAGIATSPTQSPALNLALAIDISGSMAGAKLEAARATAAAVARVLTARDRLSIIAFDSEATLLLDAKAMNARGQTAALAAIRRLQPRGGTNLWEGWLLAGERVATAMAADDRASHRILLLSDGQANEGLSDTNELARHTAELLLRGIITSAVGIGDGYDEALLGAMTEAGGGRLHDAEEPREIGEVVLGELLEGRATLLDRATLRVVVPANIRAEVVGAWAHSILPGAIEVMVGALLPDSPKRVVVRLHCPAGAPGLSVILGASARASEPGGTNVVEAAVVEETLQLAQGQENNAQVVDEERSFIAFTAWQAEAMRRAVALNREGDRRGAKHFLERELRWLERYARGLAGTEPMLAELVLLLRRVDEEMDPRMLKAVYFRSAMRARQEVDLRRAPQEPLADLLRKSSRK